MKLKNICLDRRPEKSALRFVVTATLKAILIIAISLALNDPSRAYDPGYPFDEYPLYRKRHWGCNEDTLAGANRVEGGPIWYNCQITQLAKLRKPGFDKIRKFVATACASGKSDDMARFNTEFHAKEMLTKMQNDAQKSLGAEADEYFVNVQSDYHCERAGGGVETTSPRKRGRDRPGVRPPEPDLARAPEPKREPEPEPEPLRQPSNRVTFIIHNDDRYALGLEFYAQSRDAAWPGDGQQYILKQGGTYELNCRPGEKICFGAWRDHQSTYWGVGKNDQHGCEKCCTTCGNTFETTLSDGGPDAYESSGGGGSSVGDALDAAISILGGVSGAIGRGSAGGGGSYNTYRAPAGPKPAPRTRPSDITR